MCETAVTLQFTVSSQSTVVIIVAVCDTRAVRAPQQAAARPDHRSERKPFGDFLGEFRDPGRDGRAPRGEQTRRRCAEPAVLRDALLQGQEPVVNGSQGLALGCACLLRSVSHERTALLLACAPPRPRHARMGRLMKPSRAQLAMFELWASRMLNTTSLPVYVMHDNSTAAALRKLPLSAAGRAVVPWPIELIRVSPPGTKSQYRHQYSKLHAWALPCTTVACARRRAALPAPPRAPSHHSLLPRNADTDYDGFPLRNMDGIFDACGEAPFCGVADRSAAL